MYLSKLEIDRRNPSARNALINCQDMHRNLMKAFPLQLDGCNFRQESGVLYRLETKGTKNYLYVTSDAKPDWNLIEKQGYAELGLKDISSVRDKFSNGDTYSFDILLAPTKKVPREDKKNSQRVIIRDIAERRSWLDRKAEQSGFIIEWVIENGFSNSSGKHVTDKGGTMQISYTKYKGVLRVIDAEKFKLAYKNGIGSGKSYGLGMLMLFAV